MIDETLLIIKQDKLLYHYLKYHSYWYKIIKRDNLKVKDMVNEMKKELGLTKEDKLKELNSKIETISSLIDILL